MAYLFAGRFMNEKSNGSCLCGKVSFEILGEFESFFLCHCKYCQKDTGSAHAANLFSQNAEIKWLKGKEEVKTFNLPSTRHIKSFCKECGSALPTEQKEEKLLVVPAGSLDSEISIRPKAHIFCSSEPSWSKDLISIDKFQKFPE